MLDVPPDRDPDASWPEETDETTAPVSDVGPTEVRPRATTSLADAATCDILQTTVYPELLADRGEDRPLRIWVVGCANGEQAYAHAICAMEAIAQSQKHVPLEVFATDIDDDALAVARAGIYPQDACEPFAAEQLPRFFEKVRGGYQVRKHLRERCIFSHHDVGRDIPFSHIDLVSCRNVLPTIGTELQTRVLSMLHYALRTGGVLMLGPGDTVGHFEKLLERIDDRRPLFVKVGNGQSGLSALLTAIARPTARLERRRVPSDTRERRADSPRAPRNRSLHVEPPTDRSQADRSALLRPLDATHQQLQRLDSEHHTSMERLRGANDQLLTSNEELRTAQEELRRVNDDLETRNRELARLNDDLDNLLASTHIPIVMVGRDLCIRRFTPSARKIVNLVPSDVGRPIADLAFAIEGVDLRAILRRVLDEGEVEETEVRHTDGHWYRLSARPYRTKDDAINGVVVAMQDIDALKRGEARLRAALDFESAIVEAIREPLVALDDELRIVSVNAAFSRTFHMARSEVEGRALATVGDGMFFNAALSQALQRMLSTGEAVDGIDLTVATAQGQTRSFLAGVRPMEGQCRNRVLLALQDVTEARRANELEAQLIDGVLQAQSDERERVARELHDETGQSLTALLVGLQSIGVDDEPARARARLETLREQVRTLIDDVARIARGLHPATLDGLGLFEALRALTDQYRAAHGIDITFVGADTPTLHELPAATSLGLYRVVQEALTNVVRHARATAATVEVQVNDMSIQVTVSDDGRGFDLEVSTIGMGLALMEKRVSQLGGHLALHSDPGDGTTLEVELPIPSVG